MYVPIEEEEEKEVVCACHDDEAEGSRPTSLLGVLASCLLERLAAPCLRQWTCWLLLAVVGCCWLLLVVVGCCYFGLKIIGLQKT